MPISLPWRDPLQVFAAFADQPYAALLHAGRMAEGDNWTIIVARPSTTIEARGNRCFVDGALSSLEPFESLHSYRGSDAARPFDVGGESDIELPFTSGLVGFVGYEMGAVLEPSAGAYASPYTLPDMCFGVYDAALLFHHGSRQLFATVRDSRDQADQLIQAVEASNGDAGHGLAPSLRFMGSTFDRCGYERAVEDVIERIRAGEIFQANISQRFSLGTDENIDPFALAKTMFDESASRYGAFLRYDAGAIVSNSPERFFKVTPTIRGLHITADPIKGTRPRSLDRAEDDAFRNELINDPKDRAENVMIADLTRNDLSRICADGTVTEDFVCKLVSYAKVHHLVSRISGVLNNDLTAADALANIFPCGSITGAPKIESMKVIGRIEGQGRGPYCGAVGYIDDRGGAEFSVAIRTAIFDVAARRLDLAVGGGITLRSSPKAEYLETLAKARSTLGAWGINLEDYL